jgi:ribose transport system substrate-binding protein
MFTCVQRTILLSLCLGALFSARGADPAYTIAVIPKGTTHEFWKSIHAGAIKAERELNAHGNKFQIIWKGPLREDDRDQQIQVVENFARRASAIVLAPLDSQALVKPVHYAVQSKVPVVIMDSDLKSDEYVSFVATDNYKGGQLAGEQMGKLLGGKGNVILLRYQVGSASTEAREAGFLDVLKKSYPGIKIISSDQHAGATIELGYSVSQNLLNRFGREVNGIFCPCEPPTIGMAKALRNLGLAGGKVKMIGFDAGSQSVLDMKNGDLQALVVQNPMLMGYLGVITAASHLQGQSVEKRIDTGVVLVTPQNMNQPQIRELLYPPLDQYLK